MEEQLSFHTQYNIPQSYEEIKANGDALRKAAEEFNKAINEDFTFTPNINQEITREQLGQNVEDWALDNIGSSFIFREHQKETIVDILYNIINKKNRTQVIEAPTGSGKSLLNIIAAGVLADVYGKTSYILASDLYLWKQYDDFISKHPKIKRKFGVIKGQTGNYVCNLNHEDMRNAECRMAGISWAKMFDSQAAANLGYPCAALCKYVKERKKALNSKVVMMTYQLYHYMINVVSKTMPGARYCFKFRDTLFMDECHNIPTIVKNNFQPEIKYNDLIQLETLYSYGKKDQLELQFDENKQAEQLVNDIISEKELKERFDSCWEIFTDPNAGDFKDQKAIYGYTELLEMFLINANTIETDLQYKRQVLGQQFNERDRKLYKACSYLRNCCCFWSDFKMCVEETGIEYVIKEIEENRNTKQKVVKFTDVKEDYLSYHFLIGTAENRVMMSATIGGYEAFYENAGLKYVETSNLQLPDEEIEYTVIPSTFNFNNSPIHFFNRYKMSFAEKQNSFPKLQQVIYKICDGSYKDVKGMIQTGSYANAQELYNNAPAHIKSRMLLYDGSKDKGDKITLHQMSKNTILVGPTLVEGIDLPGDDCRFIVILKVPYPVIVDKYVKEKIKLFPKWYNSTTSNTIIQGIGRGNRFKDDYCTTYILDACFLNLYTATKDQYPVELQQRIKIYN